MSFVERSIILCPYLGGSTSGGSTVFVWVHAIAIRCGDSELPYNYKCIKMVWNNKFFTCT